MPSPLIDPALLEHVEEQRRHNQAVIAGMAGLADRDLDGPAGLAWLREAMAPGGLFGMQAHDDVATTRTVPGPAGGPDVPVRVLVPPGPGPVTGVVLDVHGGGFTLGSAAGDDGANWPLAQALGAAVVSVDYRLAPEHPFPASPDDCEAVGRWLVACAPDEFGTDRVVATGVSAGATLSLQVLLRLRDRPVDGARARFVGAALTSGAYDLGGTPSSTALAGKVPYSFGRSSNRGWYLPGRSPEECRVPDVSPLWADLAGLPPVLLSVGTADWLLDDSLFLAARLEAAGSPVDLAVYPEGPHGVDGMPTAMGRIARGRVVEHLRRCLAGEAPGT